MACIGDASFRVYSPAELRTVPLRPSSRPPVSRAFKEELREGLAEFGAVGPRALLKWLGLGVAMGALLLTACILLLNLTDDTRVGSRNGRSNLSAPQEHAPATRPLPVSPTVATPAPAPAPVADFELPDDAPQPTALRAASRVRAGAKARTKGILRRSPY
jgi:hypothetical protein